MQVILSFRHTQPCFTSLKLLEHRKHTIIVYTETDREGG